MIRSKFFIALILIILFIFSRCSVKNENVETKDSLQSLSKTDSGILLSGIWQLDYYPDSILFHKSINKYSKWSSSYAYNIEFSGDSCQFIGCHESWWNKLGKVNDNLYRTITNYDDHFEIRLSENGTFFLTEFRKEGTLGPYPYHQVNKILTLDSLERRIAKEIFAGQYQVLFSDTLKCNPVITLDGKFNITGIEGMSKYEIETEDDWDTALENSFYIIGDHNQSKRFSFQFSGDTLRLMNYRFNYEENEFGLEEITTPAIIMKKIN
jgi:hypothetical protein